MQKMTEFQILFVLCASLACLVATEIEYDMDHRCTKYHGDPNIVLCPRPTEKEVLLKGQARRTIFDFLAKDMQLIIDSKKTPNLRIIKILNGQCPSIKSNRIIQIENSDSICKIEINPELTSNPTTTEPTTAEPTTTEPTTEPTTTEHTTAEPTTESTSEKTVKSTMSSTIKPSSSSHPKSITSTETSSKDSTTGKPDEVEEIKHYIKILLLFVILVLSTSVLLIILLLCRGTTRGRNCVLNCLYKYFKCCLCFRDRNTTPSPILPSFQFSIGNDINDELQMEEI